ncbi:hypothetical protein Trydic_g12543 [Trypoxylus dichotomus]
MLLNPNVTKHNTENLSIKQVMLPYPEEDMALKRLLMHDNDAKHASEKVKHSCSVRVSSLRRYVDSLPPVQPTFITDIVYQERRQVRHAIADTSPDLTPPLPPGGFHSLASSYTTPKFGRRIPDFTIRQDYINGLKKISFLVSKYFIGATTSENDEDILKDHCDHQSPPRILVSIKER